MLHAETSIFVFALIGGIIPPLVWLLFWLREDIGRHPQSKTLLAATFIGGMIMVPVALFLENMLAAQSNFAEILSAGTSETILLSLGPLHAALPSLTALFILFFLLVGVEELVKYAAAQGIAFPNKHLREPVDAMIYMITAALGFAAAENILFITNSLSHAGVFAGTSIFYADALPHILLGANLRFLGANVLHVVTSGFLGALIGMSFYKPRHGKVVYVILGLILASLLHAIFNFFIILYSDTLLSVFLLYWFAAVILIYMFERVKRIKQPLFTYTFYGKKKTIIP